MNLNKEKRGCFVIINSLKAKYGIDPSPDVIKSIGVSKIRIIGRYWELAFCELALEFEKHFTPTQIGLDDAARWYGPGGGGLLVKTGKLSRAKQRLLPDITVWSFPGEHHEIKHKDPFTNRNWHNNSLFGLEYYRARALWRFAEITGQDVMYTIHNHALTNGRLDTRNNIDHWVTCNILNLKDTHVRTSNTETLYNGRRRRKSTLYWDTTLWMPLSIYWMRRKESYLDSCRRIYKELVTNGLDPSDASFSDEMCAQLKRGSNASPK